MIQKKKSKNGDNLLSCLILVTILVASCGYDFTVVNVPGESTASEADDSEADTGSADTGSADTGSADTGSADTGSADTGSADTGSADTGSADTGSADTGSADTGSADTGSADTGSADTGSADTGSADTGSADTDSTQDINDCDPNPCVYGTCIDGINSYLCSCNDGWTGINCDREIDVASMSCSLDAPVVDCYDIANYATPTWSDKWWFGADEGNAGAAKGQTFTTADVDVLLRSITYQIPWNSNAEPIKWYVIRVGEVDLNTNTFKEIDRETATQEFAWYSSGYMTWTLSNPVMLSANTQYGVDIIMIWSSSDWVTGIPYLNGTGDEYPGGSSYLSGGPGIGFNEMAAMSDDRVFYIDLYNDSCLP